MEQELIVRQDILQTKQAIEIRRNIFVSVLLLTPGKRSLTSERWSEDLKARNCVEALDLHT